MLLILLHVQHFALTFFVSFSFVDVHVDAVHNVVNAVQHNIVFEPCSLSVLATVQKWCIMLHILCCTSQRCKVIGAHDAMYMLLIIIATVASMFPCIVNAVAQFKNNFIQMIPDVASVCFKGIKGVAVANALQIILQYDGMIMQRCLVHDVV